MYTGKTKTADVGFVVTLQIPQNKDTFQMRRDVCQWLSETPDISTSACGDSNDECGSVTKARYTLHLRGDTWSSNRPIDALVSGSIPMFVSQEQYEILPDFLPWKDITYKLSCGCWQ